MGARMEACHVMDASLERCVSDLGGDLGHILDEIPKRFHDDAIYLTGSLIEGFGNDQSDLDVMIVTDQPLDDIPFTVKKDLMVINMIFMPGRRVDLEYIDISTLCDPINEIAGLDIPVDFVAERIDERQELMIHRLTTSRPVFDNDAYQTLSRLVSKDQFRRYMIKRSFHKIDGAALDLEGFLSKSQIHDAMFRLFDIIDLTVDAYRFGQGMTNPLPKWRLRSLACLNTPEAAALHSFYVEHRLKRSPVDLDNLSSVKTYCRDLLYWSDKLLRDVYG